MLIRTNSQWQNRSAWNLTKSTLFYFRDVFTREVPSLYAFGWSKSFDSQCWLPPDSHSTSIILNNFPLCPNTYKQIQFPRNNFGIPIFLVLFNFLRTIFSPFSYSLKYYFLFRREPTHFCLSRMWRGSHTLCGFTVKMLCDRHKTFCELYPIMQLRKGKLAFNSSIFGEIMLRIKQLSTFDHNHHVFIHTTRCSSSDISLEATDATDLRPFSFSSLKDTLI